ncbi:hypothetical protein ACQKMD_18650 [Viridibacillus sp. NPDC096237]|uniref:hypothetical protein n=1 Tax=Viridibacillus sp. NPDC096237 TaxID=3390721 RepID=UPI003D03D04B
MYNVHFYENKTLLLNQCLRIIPLVEENIKIKGRKGKVVDVITMDKNNVHVHLIFEKEKKNQPLAKDNGKKRK